MNGRIAIKGIYSNRIDISQLEKGIYAIQLINKEGQKYKSQFSVI